MTETPFPHVPLALIERLEQTFRDRLPADLESDTQLARLIGQQDVIRKLRSEHKKQTESVQRTTTKS